MVEKKLRGGFLSILGTLSKPLLASAAGAIGGEVLKGLEKSFLRGDIEDDTQENDAKGFNMPKNNILPQSIATARCVQLPNRWVFFAKYEWVNRHVLALTQVRINRIYVRKIEPRPQRKWKIGPRNRRKRQRQAGVGLDLATAIDLGRRAAGSNLGKTITSDAIDLLPTAYKKIKNEITNKKVKTMMNTGIEDYFVNKGIDLIFERFNYKVSQGVFLILRSKRYLKK